MLYYVWIHSESADVRLKALGAGAFTVVLEVLGFVNKQSYFRISGPLELWWKICPN